MSAQTKAKKGFLGNAFQSHFWDSRITTANTSRKEMWLGYVLGVWGMMMTSSIVNSYYNQYLTDVLGFTSEKGLWIASFMVLFPVLSKLIDAVTNLVMSKVIDSTICRQGKARPWLLISIPFVFVSLMLLFWIPVASPIAQAIWVVVAFNLYYSVAFTMWNMSKELTAPLSTRNVNQRKNLSFAAQIVSNVGTGLVSILFPTILSAVVAASSSTAQGYFNAVAIIACLAIPCTVIQYFYTRERVTEERRNQLGIEKADDEALQITAVAEEPLKVQAKACFQSKYWIFFVLLILLTNILANMRNISLIYYSGWVVHGNAYGDMAAIQRKFQMIALSPMGPGIALIIPLSRKLGRTKTIWTTAIFTVIGSVIALFSVGNGTMIYAGTALAAIGNIAFSYMNMTFMGDVIDQVEWKTGIRCDGLTGGVVSAVAMFAVGIAQGIFNLGLVLTKYTTPVQTGVDANGIALYADQPTAATAWINFGYQGSYIIIGAVVFLIYFFVFHIEKELPQISRELQERRIAECAAKGIEYISAEEQQRREREESDRLAEEARIQDLRALCEKKGLDFDTENNKVLAKRAEKQAKKDAKAAKKAAKAKK